MAIGPQALIRRMANENRLCVTDESKPNTQDWDLRFLPSPSPSTWVPGALENIHRMGRVPQKRHKSNTWGYFFWVRTILFQTLYVFFYFVTSIEKLRTQQWRQAISIVNRKSRRSSL